MDPQTVVKESIKKCRVTAADIRQAASETQNDDARGTLSDIAANLEHFAQQMQSLANKI
ncbi:MAG: hypothetical protein ACM3PP_12170 [Candidatus Saccharibacteria bacterium]